MSKIWLSLLLAAGSAADGAGDEPAANSVVLPQEEVCSVPFDPSAVFRDGDRLYAFSFSAGRLARADLDAKTVSFRELPDDHLHGASSVAAQGGRLFVSRRSSQEILILDGDGRLKSRFSTTGPPSALAVDHLGGIHVFSIFPPRNAATALLTVYNRDGGVLRNVGTLPDSEEPASPLARRGSAMPLLRTDARGDVWALLRGGDSAIRVGITENGQDEVDLGGAGKDPSAGADSKRSSSEAGEQDSRQAREREIRAELEKAVATLGARSDDPSVKTVVASPPAIAFSDFACGDRECVAVPARPILFSERASSVRLVVFDLDERVETREFVLEGRPTAVAGILYEDDHYSLYVVTGESLVRYRLTGL